MPNTGIDYLYPEFWAQAFDEIQPGKYNLQNSVSRKFEGLIGNMGDTVNVPIMPTSTASDYDGGEVTSTDSTTQSTVQVILNNSKKANFELKSGEYSMSAYDLIQNYGISKAEAVVKAVNDTIYLEMLKGTNFGTPIALTAFNEDYVVDIKDGLDVLKVDDNDRILVVSPSAYNKLLKADAFQYNAYAGNSDAMDRGVINSKFGFDIIPCHSVSRYTPYDLSGQVNYGSGYSSGTSTIAVDGFDDDQRAIRYGDIFTIGSDKYTVTDTTLLSGDTIGISFSPGLTGSTANDTPVLFTPSESAVGMHKSAVALAARAYAPIPEGMGARSSIVNYKGLPIRISVWQSGLVVRVQYDILFGVKLTHNERLYRLPLTA